MTASLQQLTSREDQCCLTEGSASFWFLENLGNDTPRALVVAAAPGEGCMREPDPSIAVVKRTGLLVSVLGFGL